MKHKSRYATLAHRELNLVSSCETCKWNKGQMAGAGIGIGNDYPCNDCRVDRWEPCENILEENQNEK